jgi:hypothetical protein
MRVTARPARWIQVGVSRAALFGGRFEGGSVPFDPQPYGPDRSSFSARDIPPLVVGKNTQFDDQIAALDVRISLAGLGTPAQAYAEVGVEEADRSWGDPALIAGIVLALSAPAPLALRYEYVAFGRGARFCASCDTLPAFWYQHTRFQSGWRAGDELLGHPLGGYGRQHSVGAAGWSRDGRIRANFRLSTLRREGWNLLAGERPGRSSLIEGGAFWRFRPRAELSVAGWEERGRGHRHRAWRIGLTGLL